MVCHFLFEDDDRAVRDESGPPICVRCLLRETESLTPVPPIVAREVAAVLSNIAPGNWLKDS